MTFFAKIHIDHPALVLGPTIDAADGLSFQVEYQADPDPETTLLFLSVFGDDLASLEPLFRTDHTVEDPRLLTESDSHRVYRLTVTTDRGLGIQRSAELGARVLDVTSGASGWVLRMQVPSRESLVAFREQSLERGFEFRIEQLYDSEVAAEQYGVGLTDDQRRTLLTAFDLGYYDVPRRSSQEEIADALGVSASAVSQRLRRATKQLVRNTLVTEAGPS